MANVELLKINSLDQSPKKCHSSFRAETNRTMTNLVQIHPRVIWLKSHKSGTPLSESPKFIG